MMEALGIEAIEPFRPVVRDSSAYTFSTNLYGVKRPELGSGQTGGVRVSQARLTFADTMNCCMDTVRALIAPSTAWSGFPHGPIVGPEP